MDDAYQNALRTVADAYESEVSAYGGKSLARVATIVVSRGTFFQSLRDGKPFLVHNLDRLASWFRDPQNWPCLQVPDTAANALISIGRPPLDASIDHLCVKDGALVACDRRGFSHESVVA